jgi:hypothetical protein
VQTVLHNKSSQPVLQLTQQQRNPRRRSAVLAQTLRSVTNRQALSTLRVLCRDSIVKTTAQERVLPRSCSRAVTLYVLQRLRDECITLHTEDHPYCKALIEAHLACLRMEGFNVSPACSDYILLRTGSITIAYIQRQRMPAWQAAAWGQ